MGSSSASLTPPTGGRCARLTEEGRKQIDGIWKEGLEHQFTLVEGLSKEELARLRHLCLKLVENARKELGK